MPKIMMLGNLLVNMSEPGLAKLSFKYGVWNAVHLQKLQNKGMNEAFELVILDRLTEGWGFSTEDQHTSERVVLRKAGTQSLVGHVLVAMLTFWTAGIGNIVYYYFRKFGRGETEVLRASALQHGSSAAQHQQETPSVSDPSDSPLSGMSVQDFERHMDLSQVTEGHVDEAVRNGWIGPDQAEQMKNKVGDR